MIPSTTLNRSRKVFFRPGMLGLLALSLIWGYHRLSSKTNLGDFLFSWMLR